MRQARFLYALRQPRRGNVGRSWLNVVLREILPKFTVINQPVVILYWQLRELRLEGFQWGHCYRLTKAGVNLHLHQFLLCITSAEYPK
jgi:hypothetical protein